MNKSTYYIVGKHPVLEALKNKERKVLKLFLTEESKKTIHRESPNNNLLKEIKVFFKTKKELDNYCKNENILHQGFVAEVEKLENKDLKEFIKNNENLNFVCLAGATDHFNYKIPTDENCPVVVPDPKNPRWSYGNSKALGEQAVIASGIPYTIIRYFNVYGPEQKDHFISEFYDKIKKNKFELEGYNNTRTFLYIDDAVKATELLVNNRKSRNQIFNIGGEHEIKIKYVAKLIMKLSKLKGNLKYLSHPEGSVLRRCPDISKIKKITKFKVKTNLEDGLIKTLKI